MLVLVLGIVLTATTAFAFVSSAFIIFILLTSKQYKSNTSLLHLQLMVTSVVLSLLFIVFSTPSFIKGRWLVGEERILTSSPSAVVLEPGSNWDNDEITNVTGNFTSTMLPTETTYPWFLADDLTNSTNFTFVIPTTLDIFDEANATNNFSSIAISPEATTLKADVLARLYGFLFVMFHTIAVWVVVGLHCDKYCAIATPLRYNQIVTRNRIAAFSVLIWFLGLGLAIPPLVSSYAYAFAGGVCLPMWHRAEAVAYTWTFTTLCIILPFVIILIVNGRIIIIARHHQHRIFSAIFEVMMSAQATVTHQKNPFDVPKKKRKSVWTVLEQIAAFVVCYMPFFVTIIWASLYRDRINQYFLLLGVALLIMAPLVNSFIYGIKCKNIRKAFRNYLRKKLYKTEVKHEIQARIPSASNSRRPSISSTLAMPILQKSLQRRMSDYLLQDQLNQPKLMRRSSDMSWHPLEDGTPSPTRLRKPLDAKVAPTDYSPVGSHSPQSDTNFLTVPTFEAARSYYLGQQRVRLSISSLDSDLSISVRESRTEEDNLTSTSSPENPSRNVPANVANNIMNGPPLASLGLGMNEITNVSRSKSLELPLVSCHGSPSQANYECTENKHQADCQTPLLCKTFEPPKRSASLTSSSPYVLRTLEAILSVRISQNLLRRGSGWGGSLGSIERLANFLRERRRSNQPDSSSSYSPFATEDANDTMVAIQQPQHTNHKYEGNGTCPENGDLSVLTFISPLPNGGPCVGACNKETPMEMETTLTVT